MSDADVRSMVFEAIKGLLNDSSFLVTQDMPLIGGTSRLDSMQLVELCLALEDIAAGLGATFDWTSEAAMSQSRSMFRTAGSLADELVNQIAKAER